MAGRQHAQQVGGDSVYISQLPYQTDIIMTSMWRPTKPASPSQHVATVYVHWFVSSDITMVSWCLDNPSAPWALLVRRYLSKRVSYNNSRLFDNLLLSYHSFGHFLADLQILFKLFLSSLGCHYSCLCSLLKSSSLLLRSKSYYSVLSLLSNFLSLTLLCRLPLSSLKCFIKLELLLCLSPTSFKLKTLLHLARAEYNGSSLLTASELLYELLSTSSLLLSMP